MNINRFYILPTLLFVISIGLLSSCSSDNKAKVFTYYDKLVDEASLLSKNEVESLRGLISDFGVKNKVELMIVIKDSLRGKTIFDLSEQIYKQSVLTQIESGKWILIVVVTADRELRINVGTGTEDRLSDKNCGIVIREEIVPQFKNKKYFDGFKKGIIALANVLERNK